MGPPPIFGEIGRFWFWPAASFGWNDNSHGPFSQHFQKHIVISLKFIIIRAHPLDLAVLIDMHRPRARQLKWEPSYGLHDVLVFKGTNRSTKAIHVWEEYMPPVLIRNLQIHYWAQTRSYLSPNQKKSKPTSQNNYVNIKNECSTRGGGAPPPPGKKF